MRLPPDAPVRSRAWIGIAAAPLAAAAWLLVACAPLGTGPGRGIAELADPPHFPFFARHPTGTPVVSSGSFGMPIMVFDPAIYVDEEGYHLFYTTVFCRRTYGYSSTWNPASPDDCDIVRDVGSIAYAYSANRGRSWHFRQTPVVMPGHTGFDSAKIETPHVFRLGDSLYLAYSADGDRAGEEFPSRYQIGVAKLDLRGRSVRETLMDEERRFERRSSPLLFSDPRPGRFDNNVQEPSIVVREWGIELYYVGLGLRLPDAQMDAPGQAITSVSLGRAELDLDLNVIYRSESGVRSGANIAEVKYFGGAYHLFASTLADGEFHRHEAITYATSPDGVSWTEPQVILAPRSTPGFDNWGLMAPTVAVERDRIVLFYTAYEAAFHTCFPVPADGRFGRPVADGSRCLFATLGRAVSSRVGLR